jgi:hypothetical protein
MRPARCRGRRRASGYKIPRRAGDAVQAAERSDQTSGPQADVNACWGSALRRPAPATPRRPLGRGSSAAPADQRPCRPTPLTAPLFLQRGVTDAPPTAYRAKRPQHAQSTGISVVCEPGIRRTAPHRRRTQRRRDQRPGRAGWPRAEPSAEPSVLAEPRATRAGRANWPNAGPRAGRTAVRVSWTVCQRRTTWNPSRARAKHADTTPAEQRGQRRGLRRPIQVTVAVRVEVARPSSESCGGA